MTDTCVAALRALFSAAQRGRSASAWNWPTTSLTKAARLGAAAKAVVLASAEHFTIWMVNRFGEPILLFDDGSVHYLDIGAGKLSQIAESRDNFVQKVDLTGNANDWFMIPLVDQCVAAGFSLGPDQCYAFRQLPALGGDYVTANVMVSTLAGYYEYAGLVHEQLRGYPDGTRVEIRIDK